MPVKLLSILISLIDLYFYFILVVIIGSWFPKFQYTGIYRWIAQFVLPYLKIFRGIIPPIAGIDLSPMLAFLALELIKYFLIQIASSLSIA